MTKAVAPSESIATAWRQHENLERTAAVVGPDFVKLLAARRVVAERHPGCARAILNEDPLKNWDNGRLIEIELEKRS